MASFKVISTETTPPAHGTPSPWSEGTYDWAIADVDAVGCARLDDGQAFLNSLGFATVYDHPPATRVRLCVSADQTARVGFYREVKRWAIVRLIEFVGFPTLNENDLRKLLVDRGARAASYLRLHAPGLDTEVEAGNGTVITHDVIAQLPIHAAEYLASLGKQKRQQLPRYWRKLEREFEGRVRMEFVARSDVDVAEVNRLVAFNQQRMGSLGKGNFTDQESRKQQRREPLTLQKGLLGKLMIQDRMVGGTFNYLHRDEAFLIVIAHDPAWEKHNLGHLALWRTVEHCIGLRVRRYHFFWGRKRYKNDLGGVDHAISEFIVSRNPSLLPLWKARRTIMRNWPRAIGWVKRKLTRSTLTNDAHED